MRRLAWIPPGTAAFPPVEEALADPNGLLAVGGDLTPPTLLHAYRHGIFPWYGEGEPILWWSPDPRLVLFPDRLHLSRSLRRTLRQGRFRVSIDRAFDAVVAACAAPRPGQDGTWITPEMARAYGRLHRLGYAHSVEVWEGDALVGGLYGVSIGRVFFGESMFSRRSDASKVALAHLAARLERFGFVAIDCQVASEHLLRLGAEPIPRHAFVRLLEIWCPASPPAAVWETVP